MDTKLKYSLLISITVVFLLTLVFKRYVCFNCGIGRPICSGPYGLDCIDTASVYKNGNVFFTLINNHEYDIEILNKISADKDCKNIEIFSINGITNYSSKIEAGESAIVFLNCGPLQKKYFITNMKIEYKSLTSQETKTVKIKIHDYIINDISD